MPELGISVNATFVDADFEIQDGVNPDNSPIIRTLDFVPEQPDKVLNASLFYNFNDNVEARIAYSKLGTFVDVISNNEYSQRSWDDFDTIDLSFCYWVTTNLQLKFDAKNILSEDIVRLGGQGFNRVRGNIEFETSYTLSAAYTF